MLWADELSDANLSLLIISKLEIKLNKIPKSQCIMGNVVPQCVPVLAGGTDTHSAVPQGYSTPCYLRAILESFMVKQDFKNNPVIGMSAEAGSSAELLHKAKDTERESGHGSIRITSGS